MAILDKSCRHFAWELRKRAQDWAALRWPEERYHSAVNEAIRLAPVCFWPDEVDVTLTTVEDTRRYSLAALTDIDDTEQVTRIWLDGTDDHDYPLGGWFIEDDAGVLTLITDRTHAADLTIRLEYKVPWAELSCSATATGTTQLEEDWIVNRAMVILLEQNDPGIHDAALAAESLAYYRQRVRELEDLKGSRPEPEKMRVQRW